MSDHRESAPITKSGALSPPYLPKKGVNGAAVEHAHKSMGLTKYNRL